MGHSLNGENTIVFENIVFLFSVILKFSITRINNNALLKDKRLVSVLGESSYYILLF